MSMKSQKNDEGGYRQFGWQYLVVVKDSAVRITGVAEIGEIVEIDGITVVPHSGSRGIVRTPQAYAIRW